MGEKKILIEGSEYISSARAAELVGYTKDYVGQLARNGKIKAKRVGRNWYIEEASISKHKLSVHYTLTKPKKTRKIDKSGEEAFKYAINISDKHDISRIDSKVGNAITKEHSKEYVNETKDTDGRNAVDLFPKISKASHDVLLRSDIHYIKDNVTQNSHTAHQSSKNPEEFQSVPVRRATLGGIYKRAPLRDTAQNKDSFRDNTHNSSRPESKKLIPGRQHVPVDGIVMNINKSRKLLNGSDKNLSRTKTHLQKARPVYTNTPSDASKYSNESNLHDSKSKQTEISKAVPVVGAIILFTAIAVIYILYSYS